MGWYLSAFSQHQPIKSAHLKLHLFFFSGCKWSYELSPFSSIRIFKRIQGLTTLSYGSRGQPRKFIGPKNTAVCMSKRCRLLLNNWNRIDDKNNSKKHQRNPILLILSISTINFQGPNDKNPPTEVPPRLQWEHTALQSTNDALNLPGPDWIARYPWWLGPGNSWLERAKGLLTLGGIPRISNHQTKSPNSVNYPP